MAFILFVFRQKAKRWDTNPISREDVQKFVGALHGQKANKGIFINTSTFVKTSIEYANTIHNEVVLIDGRKLAELMFETGLGLSTVTSRQRIDADYFLEDLKMRKCNHLLLPFRKGPFLVRQRFLRNSGGGPPFLAVWSCLASSKPGPDVFPARELRRIRKFDIPAVRS